MSGSGGQRLAAGCDVPAAPADIKALQARWHPDRFIQKFGARLPEGPARETILRKVTETAAAINVLRDTIAASGGGKPPQE